MVEQKMTCIVCPRSCRITVQETENGPEISGQGCKRGLNFAKCEVMEPMRMLTSTVAIRSARLRRLPVISSAEVPKRVLGGCLAAVYALCVEAPVQAGDVLVRDLCGTGVDLLAARSMGRVDLEKE